MPHKFKIGAVVSYRPVDRLVSALRGTYIVTEHKPALDGNTTLNGGNGPDVVDGSPDTISSWAEMALMF